MNLTRRQLLRIGAGVGVATAGGVLLTACGDDAQGTAGQASSGAPRKGGVLRVGALGKASAITRDPHGVQNNESDFLILSLVYDALTVPGVTSNVAPRLAATWEPSADVKRWRFTIAEGATFHDGTPVTADDVVWSLQRLRNTPAGKTRLPGVEADAIQADGTNAVTLTSTYANSELPLLARLTTFTLKKDTADVAGSPGTGPFKLESFQDGNARLVRNDAWYGGDVLLDAVEVRMFESPQAMANALLAGQIDLASNVGAVAARVAESRSDVQIVKRPNDMAMPIVMRVADGPFADVRVREALRLAVDREAMVKQVLSGYGTVANDVLGTADPAYDKALPQRTRDLERAKRLLTEAGFDRAKTYQLYTTEDIPGLAESATLFATQMRDVDVKIEVVKQESSAFWDGTWLKSPLYTTYWGTNDSLVFFASKTMASDAAQNEAAWKDPAFDAAYQSAVATADQTVRTGRLKELQKIEYERSGYLLWGMADGVDLAAAKVRDLPKLGGYGRVQLERTWLSA
ncbi:ABC transporter substrate-binding protein [Phytohabitans aurantiacus]|uniref:ABC transporter substrate-binding protein n=1 Tax=Phytohabitans aurantiacus TaxID=3016789 RepID=A0ABQ5QQV6_9ACTN|nr:ABC transporter substrate-binding protein [Phytohabitans aurantiacus]GLH96665.1 ABC transporter substrate-binding protein [Phytohabitans aurantiacus]